ncbi:FAD-binding domain-containing protein [Phanerochaete sordida]|uniref:FAD-binding domain-containing protein n=1 Tax=Phanerochaete sordida TaxID=48140 RepID=A0A9P3LLS5_9APHY|nr:FAD-binding domain-containing protein [Phanerochaete sordida]
MLLPTTLLNVCTWLNISCGLFERLFEASSGSPATVLCRCLSTEPCWPSEAAFAELENQLTGPVIHPQPAAQPCYSSPESEECQTVKLRWHDGSWRADNPGATQHTNFAAYVSSEGEVEACYLNTTRGYPCGRGSVSSVGVDARSAQDVQLAVKFAAKHNLRAVVKNTGHDFLGRSSARGSLLIWTHHLNDIEFHGIFKPANVPGTIVYHDVTVGAGVQWQEAYDTVFTHGRVLIGGISLGGTVGAAGGWLQGGGHSILSPLYGLGVDNVIEIIAVTSTGELLVANAYSHPDLFWALRGGGGGTWGVVVSATYQTHAPMPIIAASFTSGINMPSPRAQATASPTLRTLFTELVRSTPSLADAGWAGYVDMFSKEDQTRSVLTIMYIAPASAPNAIAAMEQFFAFARELAATSSEHDGKLSLVTTTITPYPSFGAWETANYRGKVGQVGDNVEIGSRLLPRDLLVHNHVGVANALLDLGQAYIGFFLVAGGAVSRVDVDAAAVHPAWRTALVHTVFGSPWPDGSSLDVINAAREKVKNGEVALRKLTPDGGAYLNEASLYQADYKSDFFGSRYDKLRAVKKKYDPIDLFVVPAGVGSEDWDAALRCRASQSFTVRTGRSDSL